MRSARVIATRDDPSATATLMSADVGRLLSTWRIEPEALDRLYAEYSSGLNQAVARRAQAAAAQRRSADLVRRFDALLPGLAHSRWTRPDIAFANNGRRDPADPIAALSELADRLEEPLHEDPPPPRVSRERDPAWGRLLFEKFAQARAGAGRQVAKSLREPGDRDRERFAHALAILADAWPEQRHATTLLVRDVLWFDGNDSTSAHGAVLMSTGRDLVRMIEGLVHETTHLDLWIRLIDTLVLNASESSAMPFRDRKPPPLLVMLHAALVCHRVEHAMALCLEHLTGSDRLKAEQLQRRFHESCHVALASLEIKARWTPTGAQLFHDLVASRQSGGGG